MRENGIPRIDDPVTVPSAAESSEGTLVLIGGAATPHGHALRAFLDATEATKGARIIGLTTASSEALEAAWYWKGAFNHVGVRNIEIPIFDKREETDARIAAMIDAAQGVFLGGGGCSGCFSSSRRTPHCSVWASTKTRRSS